MAKSSPETNFYTSESTSYSAAGLSEFNGINMTVITLIESEEVNILQNFPSRLLHFGAGMCVLNSILGIWGNFFTILALMIYPSLKNATTVLIINLCIADGVFSAIGPPLTATTFINRGWVYHETLCSFKVFAQFVNTSVSVYTMAGIAVNRYILIAHPHLYRKIYTKKTMAANIAILWVIPLACWFPTFLGYSGRFGYSKERGVCTLVSNEKTSSTTNFILTATVLIIVATIISFCYFRITCIVRRSARKVRRHDETGIKGLSTAVINSGVSSNMEQDVLSNKTLRDEKHNASSPDVRMLRISLVIFIMYLLSYMPIVVVRLARLETKAPTFYIIAYLALSYSTCVNPLIYMAMSREYRNAYKNLLCNNEFKFSSLLSSFSSSQESSSR